MKQDVYYDLCCILEYPYSENCRHMFEVLCPIVEEASVLAQLKAPNSPSAVAEKLNLPLETVNGHLEALMKKGAVAFMGNNDSVPLYRFGPYGISSCVEEFTDGIIYAIAMLHYDFETDKLTDPSKQAIIDACLKFVEEDWYRFQRVDELMHGRMLTIPGIKPAINPAFLALEKSGINLPPDEARRWDARYRAEIAKSIDVTACPCRFRIGLTKGYPLMTCGFLNLGERPWDMHDKEVELGLRKRMSKEEYLEIQAKCERLGMIRSGDVCICEETACNMMYPVKKYAKMSEGFFPAPFSSVENENAKDSCTACEICIQKCQFDAIKMVEDNSGNRKAVVDKDMCYGCGVCVVLCPVDSYKLVYEPEAQ